MVEGEGMIGVLFWLGVLGLVGLYGLWPQGDPEEDLRQWCDHCERKGDDCTCWMLDPIYEYPGYFEGRLP
jgi:hypothetical protein